MLPVVRADFAFERFDRPRLGAESFVIPPLNGREAEHYPLAVNGVAPFFGGQLLKLSLELPPLRWGSQEGADHAEAKMRPAFMRPWI